MHNTTSIRADKVQPITDVFRQVIIVLPYRLNNMGCMTLPCRTPLYILNTLELKPFHLTQTNLLKYQLVISFIQQLVRLFEIRAENNLLGLTLSNALDASNEKMYTFQLRSLK